MNRAAGITLIAAGAFAAILIATLASSPATAGPGEDSVTRGRYLVQTAACNDCHTPGYAERAGDVPESQWLTGDHIGWRGPWGTTYPANLRLYFQRTGESAFIADARSGRMRPPMPWFNLARMTDADLRAIRNYVRSLGAAGEPVPAYVPPGQEPLTVYFDFEPQQPRVATASVNQGSSEEVHPGLLQSTVGKKCDSCRPSFSMACGHRKWRCIHASQEALPFAELP